jgi:hypothetical protein
MSSEKLNGATSAAFGATPTPLEARRSFNWERNVNTPHLPDRQAGFNTSTLQR